MPVDTVFSLLGKAKDLLLFILDRLDQLKLSDKIVTKTRESLEYLQRTIKKIEPYIKEDGETEEIKQFLNHLEKAFKSCNKISEKHLLTKLLQQHLQSSLNCVVWKLR